MNNITKKLRKITKSKDNQKLVFKQTNKRRVGLFVDDLSLK
jgi:hypothetical protein